MYIYICTGGLQNFFQQFQCATIYNHKLCEKTPKKTLQYQDASNHLTLRIKPSSQVTDHPLAAPNLEIPNL